MSKNIVLKEAGKFNGKPTYNLYIKDATFVYASVQEPKLKYQSKTEYEYSTQVFVSQEDADALEELVLNKELFKVGVDKNKKKKIKYPLEKDGEPTAYADYKGMVGFTVTKKAMSKAGNALTVNVVDAEGKSIDALIGNGSKGILKCNCYRNDDELLVIQLDTMVIHDLVAYEGGNGGVVVDDELGMTYERKKAEEKPANAPPAASVSNSEDPFGEDDDDIPF